jgi:GxxExxY protein
MLYEGDSYKIIGAALEVHTVLGNGFLEAVYQEALEKEFGFRDIDYCREPKIEIFYKGEALSKYYIPDFICYDKIIVELKASAKLISIDEAQVLNYLKATRIKVGLLINFGTASLEFKRFIL